MMNTVQGNAAARRDNKGAYIFVSSPFSGRQYRFYYGRVVRDVVKAVSLLAVSLLALFFIATLVVRAGDAQHDHRMEMQENHINNIDSGQSEYVSFEGGE